MTECDLTGRVERRPFLDRRSADHPDHSGCSSRRSTSATGEATRCRADSAGKYGAAVPDRAGSICSAWRRVLDDVDSRRNTDASWSALVDVIHPLMKAWTRQSTVRNRQPEADIEGIVQDAYVRLLGGNCLAMRRCRARTERQIRAYLRCVCENIATDRTRKFACGRRGGGLLVPAEDWTHERTDLERLARGCSLGSGGDADPERRTFARSRLRSLDRDIASCARVGRHAERNAWIFRQAMIHGRRTKEIAAEVDLRASSVDSVLGRMRKRLERYGWSFGRRV